MHAHGWGGTGCAPPSAYRAGAPARILPTQRRAQLTGAAVPVFAPLTHPTAAAGRSRRHSYCLPGAPTPAAMGCAPLRRGDLKQRGLAFYIYCDV